MALIKWSALVGEVKGKLNGSIFSNATYGATIRNRKATRGQVTPKWANSRRTLSVISSSWRDLTNVFVQSWINQRINYPYIDKFGDPKTPSAYQLYCTHNMNLLNINAPLIQFAQPPNPQIDLTPVGIKENAIGEVRALWTLPNDITHEILLFSSPPMSKGTYAIPQRMQMIQHYLGNVAGSQIINLELEQRWGTLQNNQKFFFKWFVVDLATGQKYGSYDANVVLSKQP